MENFSADDFRLLEAQIKHGEGLRLKAYKDTLGILTIGYGHNCQASPVPGVSTVGDAISQETADMLFTEDLSKAVSGIRSALPWIGKLVPARQAVLFDMAFNMGLGVRGKAGLLSFGNTLALIEAGDYAQASRNMLQSKWARQVGNRAVKLARQMDFGEW